jgi:hypothetical protein
MVSLGARRNGYRGAVPPLLALVLASSTADAHFKITSPPSWMSQDAVGGPQKNGPCAKVPNTALGDSAGTPTNIITVVNAGEMITVSLDVTIAHPGWFRVALAEGPSSTQTLATLPDPQAMKGTNCTPAIMSNPVWSPTQPILADGLPAGSTANTEQQDGTHTFQVTVPSTAVCTSTSPCTLQVIMMMTDHPVSDCYYHHCADISFGTGDGGGSSTGGDATVAFDASGETRDASGASSSNGSGGAGSIDASESTGSGGATGSAGSSASGATGSSASSESIGTSGSGGSAGSGAGDSNGTVPSSAASSGAEGSGSNTNAAGPADSSSGGGCGLSTGGGAPWALGAAGFFAVSTVRRRRRRR